MKKKTIIILAALIIVAVGTAITLVSCSQSGQAEPTQASVVSLAEAESSAEDSAESSLASETTSDESSDTESSVQSKAESSTESKKASSKDEESKTEKSEVSKTESKQESSKTESSKATSKSESGKAAVSQAPSTVKVTGISLSQSSLTMKKGDTVVLSATISPSNASNKNFEWSWSDSSVISVDGNGNVKALGAGSATITVKTADGGYSASCTVTVESVSQSQTSQSQSSGGNNGGNSNSNNGGNKQSSQTAQQSSTVNWNPNEHKKVYSTGGYEMYECPEIVQYVNYYRRKAGVPEVEWGAGTSYCNKIKQMFYALSTEEQEEIRRESPEYFTSSGEFDAFAFVDDDNINTRNSLEYCIKTQSLNHGNDYSTHMSLINGVGGKYDPKAWVEDTKGWAGHWEGLMDKNLTTIYVVYYTTDNGNSCTFTIN